MRDSLQLFVVLALTVVLVFASIPDKSTRITRPIKMNETIESKPVVLPALKQEILSSLGPSEFILELIKRGFESTLLETSVTNTSEKCLLIYKKVYEKQGLISQKKEINELSVTEFYVVPSKKSTMETSLLSFTKDGMFSKGQSILNVATPVFAYRILTEELKTTPKKLVFKVELLNPDLEIVSEQVVVYWSTKASSFLATNEFDPEKSF